jgi:ABC-2 type transport system permease protein
LLGGKLFANVARLLGQAAVVALLGVILGARLHPRLGPLAIALLQLSLFAWAYASLSCWIALTTRSQETMGVFIQAVNMPLLFTSAVLVPKRHMPGWLGVVAQWNPLTPVAEGLRTALLGKTDAYGFRGAVWAALTLAGIGAFLAGVVALRRSRHD